MKVIFALQDSPELDCLSIHDVSFDSILSKVC